MSSLAKIRIPRLPTDTGLEPDAARAVLDDVARVSAAVQQAEATIAELAGIINKRQKHGFYGFGGGFGVLVAVVWHLAGSAYDSYRGLQETQVTQGKQIEKMQRSLNWFYRQTLGNKARPVGIDPAVAPDPIGPPDVVTGPSPIGQ